MNPSVCQCAASGSREKPLLLSTTSSSTSSTSMSSWLLQQFININPSLGLLTKLAIDQLWGFTTAATDTPTILSSSSSISSSSSPSISSCHESDSEECKISIPGYTLLQFIAEGADAMCVITLFQLRLHVYACKNASVCVCLHFESILHRDVALVCLLLVVVLPVVCMWVCTSMYVCTYAFIYLFMFVWYVCECVLGCIYVHVLKGLRLLAQHVVY